MIILCVFGFLSKSFASQYNILVVMSYNPEMPWVMDIQRGIDMTLGKTANTRYFYLDTRNNYDKGPEKAKEAFALYQEMNPDGVIVADDNAQSMFTVPYLKDKVQTPVIFCGVNAEADAYGYPASNVTGVLERIHYIETISFLQMIVPTVKSVGFLMADNQTAVGYIEQAKKEQERFSASVVDYKLAKTDKETIRMLKELEEKCDALFVDNISGLKDENGQTVYEEDFLPALLEKSEKPTFGCNILAVEKGVLCAVVKTGQNQGELAARMLLEAIKGKPIKDMPVIQNRQGKRYINGTTMQKLGIQPKASFLVGAEIVRTK